MLKLLIIDDEEPIRRGLEKFITNNNYPVTIIANVGNGDDGLRIVKEEKPDIIITDVVMPGIKGTELIAEVKKIQIHTKIIMISGYDDINYIKTALKYDAIDYILKPIDINELKLVIEKALSICNEEIAICKEREELQSRLNESIPVLREKFLINCIENELLDLEYIKAGVESLDIDFLLYNGKYAVIIIDIINLKIIDQKQREKVNISLADVISKVLAGNGAVFNRTKDELVCIIYFDNSRGMDDSERKLYAMAENVKGIIEDRYGFIVTIGIGLFADTVEDLNKSYKSAQTALKYRFIPGSNMIIRYKDIYPFEVDNYTTSGFNRDNNHQNSRTTEAIKNIIYKRFNNYLSLQLISEELSLSPNYLSALFKREMGENIIAYLTRLRMQKAKQLLENPLTKVNDVSRSVGYDNPNYFTKIFRKFYGISPSDYKERINC